MQPTFWEEAAASVGKMLSQEPVRGQIRASWWW